MGEVIKLSEDMPPEQICQAIQEAVDGRNDLVHAAFQYGCRGCGCIEWVYLGVGVEGPEKMRERNAYIPSPFMGPRCLACGAETSHVNWKFDRNFLPQDPPPGVRYYKAPRPWPVEDSRNFGSIMFCGQLATSPGGDPRGLLVRPFTDHFPRSPRAG